MNSFFTLLLLVALSIPTGVAASGSDTLKKPWVSMHLLNYTSDADLEHLSSKIPVFAEKGINLLFLEIDYNFNFVSHPELKAPDKFITREGARKFAEVCKKNNIRLVPEFQCLGHQSWAQWTFSLLTNYPELDLTPGAFPGNKEIYCREWDPTNPRVNEIVFPLIDEIVDAFGADGIHVGMDEVFLLGSEKSPSTKGKDPAELYAKVINELHDHFVKKRGLEMFMWGDRLIDGKKYPYGDWESSNNGTAPAIDKIPNDIIICDWHYEVRESYPSIPMFLEKGFRVLPCSFKNKDASKALIKYSLRQNHPNMMGHMFTSWGGVPKDSILLYSAFTEGLHVMKSNRIWDVTIDLEKVNADGSLFVSINSENKNLKIFFTTDGSEPGSKSALFSKPIKLSQSTTVKAVAFYDDQPAGEIISRSFVVHLATGKNVKMAIDPSPKYPPSGGATALVNGIASTKTYADGQWAGFEGQDIEAVIELNTPKVISEISLRCFYDPGSWIYPGTNAEVWISSDGTNYKKAATVTIAQTSATHVVPVIISFPKAKASYVKLLMPKRLIPEGAPAGAGYPAWIFIDELAVK